MAPAWLLVAVALLSACPAPTRYAVQRADLDCGRATRVVRRTFLELGYEITRMTEPRGSARGVVEGRKTAADGTVTTASATIHCTERGVEVQPAEGALVPTDYGFSRAFDYSFTSLVQRPDVETPRVEAGLQLLIESIDPYAQRLDLGGEATRAGAALVRLTLRNGTDRAVALDADGITLVGAGGTQAAPNAEAVLDALLVPGPAAERVRRELLRRVEARPHETVVRFLVFPAGTWREAAVRVEDVETGETDGFFVAVQ